MKKQTLKKGLAAVLGLALCMQMPSVNSALQLSAYAQERAATINASGVVREPPILRLENWEKARQLPW